MYEQRGEDVKEMPNLKASRFDESTSEDEQLREQLRYLDELNKELKSELNKPNLRAQRNSQEQESDIEEKNYQE